MANIRPDVRQRTTDVNGEAPPEVSRRACPAELISRAGHTTNDRRQTRPEVGDPMSDLKERSKDAAYAARRIYRDADARGPRAPRGRARAGSSSCSTRADRLRCGGEGRRAGPRGARRRRRRRWYTAATRTTRPGAERAGDAFVASKGYQAIKDSAARPSSSGRRARSRSAPRRRCSRATGETPRASAGHSSGPRIGGPACCPSSSSRLTVADLLAAGST